MAPFDNAPPFDPAAAPMPPDPEPVQDDAPEPELSDYWGHLTGDDLAAAVIKKYDSYRQWLQSNGLLTGWKLKMQYYHNEYRSNPAYPHLAIMQTFGSQDEFQFLSINHLRSLIKTVLGAVVQNPPSFSTRATSTDADSEEAAAIYQGVLDYYLRAMRIRAKLAKAAELGIVVDSSFMMVEWDVFASTPQMQNDQTNGIWQGDIALKTLAPWDVCYDVMKGAWSDQDWVIVRDWVPRQKLLAQFPEAADDIKAASSRGEVQMGENSVLEVAGRWNQQGSEDISEDIQCFKLFFRDCPGYMPKGRFFMCLENGKMLFDSPSGLMYSRLPVERFSCDDQIDVLVGYSPINEMLAPQEAINAILSSVVTNAVNFGNQYIAAAQGTELNPRTLASGQKVLEYPQGMPPPAGLNLTSIPPTLSATVQELVDFMQRIPGVSNVSRGEVPGANSTGSAMLFSASQTAQNSGAMTQNYAAFSADVMTSLLHTLRVFGRTARTVEIAGQNVASTTIVLAEALKDFDEVIVDEGNPIMQTPQGRLGFAQSMLQFGNSTPAEVLEVATSGNLGAATDPAREAQFYLKSENEWLLQGKSVMVDAMDDHHQHIAMHSRLKNVPWLRMPDLAQKLNKTDAPAILQGINTHIQQHMQFAAQSQVNTAAGQAPGAPQSPGNAAMGTGPSLSSLAPKAGVADDSITQGSAKEAGTSLPNMPNQPK